VLYGIAIAIGNIAGGRIADRDPVKALIWLFALQALVLCCFRFTAVSPLWTLPTLAGLGFLSFANVPGLQLYVVQLAKERSPGRGRRRLGAEHRRLQSRHRLGAWIGGLVVASPLGLGATPWVGAIMVGGALLLTAVERRARQEAAVPAGRCRLRMIEPLDLPKGRSHSPDFRSPISQRTRS
jgi:DHA1 family inner membrane transport protein